MKRIMTFLLFSLLIVQTAFAAVSFTTFNGGSNLIDLGYGITINNKSSLLREWKTAHDSSLPIDFVGTIGATVTYQSSSKYTSGGYRYKAEYVLKCNEDVTAVEVIILVFNVWGQLQSKLSATEIMDMTKNQTYDFSPTWSISSEHKATEALSSLAYINQVRTKSGRIYTADMTAIVAEAQKYAKELTPEVIKDFSN
ncbi:MAG: hypothetical protein M0R38_11105 [Bacteroidia bacterium]|nr:hypothetical protein [Bacteroidia bacterium]